MKDSDHWVVGVCPDDPLALVQGRLYPEITANCVIAWRRNIPYSQAVNKMIEEINAYDEIILGFPNLVVCSTDNRKYFFGKI